MRGLGDTVPMSTGLQLDPVSGTGGGAISAPAIPTQYVCDDGSTPINAVCNDGTAATFLYSDPNGAQCDINTLQGGYCPGVTASSALPTSSFGIGTLLVIGVIAYFLFFKGRG